MQYNFSNAKAEMKKVEEFLSKEYTQLNTGRASPMVLDGIAVEVYGAFQPIKNVASVSIEDPKTLRVSPWDKSQVKAIEKAIMASNIGLSVATDESGLRVIFPQLTTETRQNLVKILKGKLEEARITVRKEREKVMDDINALTEDEKFKGKEDLQKIVDETNRNLEAIFEKKETEVMGQ
jgi:ribosome recycling factor